MKLQQAIDRVDEMRPNMQSRGIKIAGLSELDGLIWRELIIKHEMTPAEYERYPKDENGRPKMPEYDEDTDPGQTLLVPAPYDRKNSTMTGRCLTRAGRAFPITGRGTICRLHEFGS